MLKVRVIPTLLYRTSGLVKGVGFDAWRRVDTALPAVKVYNMREVDELILLDLDASDEGRPPDYEQIRNLSKECFVPFCVGGGIRNITQIQKLLRSGADKVCINSAAYENPGLVEEGARLFGSQCIVVSIDCRQIGQDYYCFAHNGRKNTGRQLREWAKTMEQKGAGELLVTSIPLDGTMQGYDLDMIREVTNAVKIPVIASGGAGNYEHMYQAVSSANASAVAAASIYHFTEQTPKEAKEYLQERGIPVRLQ